ncbi:MAG: FadR family transcriptional regulator [Microbacterium sp.]|uniref:FadR/GntR family transcriptional regulator n=1 Tax=Microbacterium sp. TaxID=51671 RepID=UPI001AD570E3|nr:FadR/GntR family transcriptional regulator [Microbacterium sp.]MBN9178838.1 FadR family transcriptional regulator [Microbacterium sp.]
MGGGDAWEPVQRVRTYEQVMHQIEQRILDGKLRAGDKLPSERDLSASLGISRASLREALRVLEALGIIEIRSGAGPEGGAVLVDSPGDGFVNLLKLQLALAHFDQNDVLETRVALETWSCWEAAYRANEADFTELAAILDRMDDDSITAAEFNTLDAAFHVRIADATGNALIAHMMGSLRTAIQRRMVDVYATLADWRETAKTVRSEHREILRALIDRDGDRAASLVRFHITSFYTNNNLGGLLT